MAFSSIFTSLDQSRRSIGDGDTSFLKGEPVITTGEDVSKYVVDLRDDMDPAITFRSLFLGTIWAGLGAAVQQVRAGTVYR